MKMLMALALLAALAAVHTVKAAPQAIPPARAAAIAQERFLGEVIDVDLDEAEDEEPGDRVYEVKLLTPAGDVLTVRIAAKTGDYLAAEGPDLVRALRPAPARKPAP